MYTASNFQLPACGLGEAGGRRVRRGLLPELRRPRSGRGKRAPHSHGQRGRGRRSTVRHKLYVVGRAVVWSVIIS